MPNDGTDITAPGTGPLQKVMTVAGDDARARRVREAKSEVAGRLLARTVRFNLHRCAASAALAETEQEARHQSLHDPLTGLANRAILDDELGSALSWLQSDPGRGFSVVYMDLDGFKLITDQSGHAVGDAVLVEVAKRLRVGVRGGDCVARVGGYEFVVLLAQGVQETDASHVAEVIQAKVEALFEPGELSLTVGVSIGTRLVTDPHPSPADQLSAADAAVYLCKQKPERGVAPGFAGRQMLTAACGWAASTPGKSLASVSVNVSANRVRSADFELHVRRAVSDSGLDPPRLQQELTEQVKWGKDEARLEALRDDGVCLVLDDFGTGYSTAEVLARFPVTTVKLSRALLLGAQANPRRMSMYWGLVELGKRLGASVTAEGIETAEQLALVKGAGATHIQGFMFGRPSARPHVWRKVA